MAEASGKGKAGRPRRPLGAGEAVEAWRAGPGLALVVFLPDGERAPLEDGRSLASMSDGELAELRKRATPLTATEAILVAPDGRRWLAQATGPAWAADAAPGILGTRFTSLDGALERFEVAGTPLSTSMRDHGGGLERALGALWRAGRQPPGAEGEASG
ncbi:MAG: hypothetical protein R6X22_02915 [Gemmatimonadota bacterium]